MVIMASECCIALIRIKIMNWSAIFLYQFYLKIVHHPSDSIGHGGHVVPEVQPQKGAIARPIGIMQIGVHIIPNRNAQKGTLAQKYRIGRPRHPTLQDGRQLLQLVCNGRTKSASAPRGEWQQLKKCTLAYSWLIKIRLVQARNSARCSRRFLLLTKNHRHSRLPLPREQR